MGEFPSLEKACWRRQGFMTRAVEVAGGNAREQVGIDQNDVPDLAKAASCRSGKGGGESVSDGGGSEV